MPPHCETAGCISQLYAQIDTLPYSARTPNLQILTLANHEITSYFQHGGYITPKGEGLAGMFLNSDIQPQSVIAMTGLGHLGPGILAGRELRQRLYVRDQETPALDGHEIEIFNQLAHNFQTRIKRHRLPYYQAGITSFLRPEIIWRASIKDIHHTNNQRYQPSSRDK